MLIRTTIIFILLLFFLTVPCQAVDLSGNWPQYETTHFDLRMEPTPYQIQAVSLREWGEMLEQFFGQLESQIRPVLTDQHDSVFPKPTLFLCATRSSYQRLLATHGLSPDSKMAGSGGFYDKSDNTIFLFLQPTSYYTRHVVLHEVTHWYCHRISGERYDRLPLWLIEGLADHCAFHSWDGKRLQAIHLPRVSLENYPKRFQTLLGQFVSDGMETEVSPASIAELIRQVNPGTSSQSGTVNHDVYALMWGVTSFLLERYPTELKRLIADWTGHDDHASRQRAFSWKPNPKWRDLMTWAETKQLPWEWVWNRWEDDGKTLTGVSDTTALIVRRSPAASSAPMSAANCDELLRVQAKPLLQGTVFGIVLNYEAPDHFEAIQWRDLTATTVSWRHVRYAGKKWESLTNWQEIAFANAVDTPEKEPTLEISVRAPKNSKILSIECDKTAILQLPRQTDFDSSTFVAGLLVQTGATQYRTMTVR